MKKNKILIIIISIILVIAIAGGVFAYLFIKTDIFRSNQELFAKYFMPNIDTFEKMTDLNTIQIHKDLKYENKFESNSNIKLISSEGGEVSNPLNNLSLKMNVQKDDEQSYFYGDAKILYENETYLKAEVIKDQEQYGIRFSEIIKQFITVSGQEEVKNVADDLGIDTEQFETIINVINEDEKLVSDEQLNAVIGEASKGIFKKQRNAIITYNGETIKTNAYTVILSGEQVKNILKILLDNTDEESTTSEIPETKITVYEQKQKNIRTVIETNLNKIIIENEEQIGKIKTRIKYSDFSNEQIMEYNFEITKANTENRENIEIVANVLSDEENYIITLLSEMQFTDNEIQVNLEISHKQDITKTSLVFENIVTIGNDFEKAEVLNEENTFSLSSIEDENVRKQRTDYLMDLVLQKISEKILGLAIILMM